MDLLIACAQEICENRARDGRCDAFRADARANELSERLASANRRICEALSAFDAEDRAPLNALRERIARANMRGDSIRRELVALDERLGPLLDALVERKMLSYQSLAY